LTPPAELREKIRRIRKLTERPFGVNLLLHVDLRPPKDPALIPDEFVAKIQAQLNRFRERLGIAKSASRPGAIPDERSPEAGKDHLGYDRYVVDTGRCFPYFAKYSYCSICLPVCVYNHKEWARDFEGAQTQSFPTVIMLSAPQPSDLPDADRRHRYPRIRRS